MLKIQSLLQKVKVNKIQLTLEESHFLLDSYILQCKKLEEKEKQLYRFISTTNSNFCTNCNDIVKSKFLKTCKKEFCNILLCNDCRNKEEGLCIYCKEAKSLKKRKK